MSIQAYEFDQNAGSLKQQADGLYIADFLLAAYREQTFHYVPEGINPDNLFVINVEVIGNEVGPVTYHPGQTEPFQLGSAIGVLLVAKRDGKDRDTIIVHLPPA